MDQHQRLWQEKVSGEVIANLKKRNMAGSYAASARQAREEVLAMIPAGASVYRGGSMSTVELELWPAIAGLPGVEVLDPYRPGMSAEEGLAIRRKGLLADIMIASSNAITMDGKLVNLDGRGNRLAAMMFGPGKVILVVGMNKVVPTLEEAMARIKHKAAPVNAIRLGVQTPCVETGLCADCRSPQRICNMWGIIEGQVAGGRIHVVLVGEELGY